MAQSSPADKPAANDSVSQTRPAIVLTDEAMRLHQACLFIDGHNDLLEKVRDQADSSFDKLDIAFEHEKIHTSIPRLRRGGVDAQFWAAYVPPTTMKTGGAARYALEQIDLIRRMIDRYPETFAFACSTDDVLRITAEGKIASLIGVEGGHAIENSLPVLRMFHELGVRYMTLTHVDTTDWCDSATDEPKHGGLAPFGEEVVREMNRLGMLVDISHVSAEAMRDVLRASRAPVIASHSSACGVAEHTRNVPDDVLRDLARGGGVVMVNFYSGYVEPDAARLAGRIFDVQRQLRAKYPDKEQYKQAMKQWWQEHPLPRGSVHTVVDHIDHIVRVAGIDHVGIGADYDGVGTLPEQLEDVSGYPCVTQELLNRGYREAEIRKILGENTLRVLRDVASARH